ncbi:MAG: phage holin family protein [Gaiellales bacterium]
MSGNSHDDGFAWQPRSPNIGWWAFLGSWIASVIALHVAAAILPGVQLYRGVAWTFVIVAVIATLNAFLAPLVAALRLPFAVALDFILSLVLSAALLQIAAWAVPDVLVIDNFAWAFAAALVISAVHTVVAVVLGVNDDDGWALRTTARIARRRHDYHRTDDPGLILLEIDGLAYPVLQRAMRDGSAPHMATWILEGSHDLAEWETDLSSQTGASQAGILLGSNADIPAFRWVEKESGRLMTCSAPADCAELEKRHLGEHGLLLHGGASRGNLLSGGADRCILTVSRIDAETHANPGYRGFFSSVSNTTQVLVLFGWEVILELVASARQRRRDVRPRGHRGGNYPFVRGALCVIVRELILYGVLQDVMAGRPIIYATFSSYDEVAHHSGLERADTMEALRKLDQAFARIDAARRFAPRPYRIAVLSDHGQTQGATFKQRNGYGLDDLVRRSLADDAASVAGMLGGDENDSAVSRAMREAVGSKKKRKRNDVSEEDVVVLGSGNLGLIYLMEEQRRLTREEIDARHPTLLDTLRTHPHVGWLLVRSSEHGALVLGANGTRYLDDDRIEGEDPLAPFSKHAADHLRRTDGFPHVADLMVGSFYDETLEAGCAFEELISFHGGLGGPQTRPFILHPEDLDVPEDLVGAEAVNALLRGWREQLQGPVGAA